MTKQRTKKDPSVVRPGAVAIGETRYYLRQDGTVTVRSLQGAGADGLAVATIPAPEGAQEISEERGMELLELATAQGRDSRKDRKRALTARKRDTYLTLLETPGMTAEAAAWLTGYRDGLEADEEQERGR